MMSLLVEGGSQVNGLFLREGLIDKIYLFFSPQFLGGDRAVGIFGGEGIERLGNALTLNLLKVKKAGEDVLIEGYPRETCSPGS